MIRMIAKDLRINPLRTSLTALSMFIGIIALITGVLVGTLGRDYLEAVNARLGGKSPTYSAIVDVPSSGNQDPAKSVSPPSSGCSTTTMTERSPMTGGTAPRGTTPTGRASAAGMSASCSRTTPSYRI